MKECKIRPIVKGTVAGEVVLSSEPISFLGDIDAKTGVILNPDNSLYGRSLKNKIFVFPEGRGSTVGSYVIYGLMVNNVAPLAMIAGHAETIVIAGAILADIPLADHPECEIFEILKSGDTIEFCANSEKIRIFKKTKNRKEK